METTIIWNDATSILPPEGKEVLVSGYRIIDCKIVYFVDVEKYYPTLGYWSVPRAVINFWAELPKPIK